MLAATTGNPDVKTLAADFVQANQVTGEDVTPLTVETALGGVSDLLADRFADDGALRSTLRTLIRNSATLVAQSTVQIAAPENAAAMPDGATVEGTGTAPVATASQLQLFTDSAVAPEAAPAAQQESAAPVPVAETPTPEVAESNAEIKAENSISGATENSPEQPPASSEATDSPGDAAPPESPTDSNRNNNPTTRENRRRDRTASRQRQPSPRLRSTRRHRKLRHQRRSRQLKQLRRILNRTTSPLRTPQRQLRPPTLSQTQPLCHRPLRSPAGQNIRSALQQPTKRNARKRKRRKPKKRSTIPTATITTFVRRSTSFPHHRILAINRGERAGKLKVKMEYDEAAVLQAACDQVIPAGHPHAEFLKTCVEDALSRLIIPSLEREIRRDMTQQADRHAVEVFANNLRNLLLQPPIRNCRVLAIDPGFKRGCSVAVLDAEGKFVASDHVFVVGNLERRGESKQKIAKLVNEHQIDMIAIGNGAACSDAERMVSDCINDLLGDHPVRYVMVNEAGASIYSTSETGREELPDLTPAVRSAVSIGRRLQDPLSELVKISPANIGVGMYQHDVRANHLSQSLDEVVEFCVNQVGVNLNTASPSLLRYVSGLNALTARRIYEHRQQLGKFTSRQQLKEVPGIGEATFVQAAGFLRIHDGEVPFDATSDSSRELLSRTDNRRSG